MVAARYAIRCRPTEANSPITIQHLRTMTTAKHLPRALALFAALMSFSPEQLHGQAVQVVRGLADPRQPEVLHWVDSVSARVQKELGFLVSATTHATSSASRTRSEEAAQVERVINAGVAALAKRSDPKAFVAAVADYQRAKTAMSDEAASRFEIQRSEFGILGVEVPQIFNKIPEVVFTLGTDVTLGSKSTTGVSIGTNMLGAAAGAAFNAIGSETLKNFFTNNISAGTTIPASRDTRISAQLGLGLGEIGVPHVTLWPVLGLEQVDTADRRFPKELVAMNPDQQAWTTAIVSVAIVPNAFLTRFGEGKFALIPSVGVRLPHYYPSDPFNALGALFSTKRQSFERAGKSEFLVSLSFPLRRVKQVE